MPVEVIMPKVDMDMASGKLAVWHAEEGAQVKKGAPLFDIETDKAAMEVESPATGRLHHVIAQPGQTVDVGQPLAWIYAEGEAVGDAPALQPADSAAPTPAAEPSVIADPAFKPDEQARASAQPAYGSSAAAMPSSDTEMGQSQGSLRATPAARRLARENGLKLIAVAGTGPHGRIQSADVVGAACARATAPAQEAKGPEAPRAESAADGLPQSWNPEAGELHVSTRKGTGTPLLMIHGFAADSMGWAPLERVLPKSLPLIRIDLPSHGRSPLQRVDSLQSLARAMTRAFDATTSGPVHLLAHSLGGAVALALADIRPRQIASLTLIAPAGLGPEIDAPTLMGIARASRAESLGPWLKRLTARPDGISWDFVRAAMLARNDGALRAAQLDIADALFPDGVQSFDLTAALERVAAPTTIIWGRQDRILPWRQALAAPGEMALHLLAETGHIPHVECPDRVAGILSRHIRGAQET